MKHRPRPTVVEKVREKINAPVVDLDDVRNVIICAKRGGFAEMHGAEIEAVGASMRRLEAAIAKGSAQPVQSPTKPPAPPTEPPKG